MKTFVETCEKHKENATKKAPHFRRDFAGIASEIIGIGRNSLGIAMELLGIGGHF